MVWKVLLGVWAAFWISVMVRAAWRARILKGEIRYLERTSSGLGIDPGRDLGE